MKHQSIMRMKQFALLCAVLSTGTMALAQPCVTTAYMANESGNYKEAVKAIEECYTDPKATAKEKYWRYRSAIYINIAKTPEMAASHPNALDQAFESVKKAMELDIKKDYEQDNKGALVQIQMLSNNSGIEQFNGGQYSRAAASFELSAAVGKVFGITDSLSIYNSSLCYEKAGMADKAVKGYLQCGEMGYNVPAVYLFAAKIEEDRNNKPEAVRIIQLARKQFPKNKDLLIEEIRFYLDEKKYAEAEENLKLAISQDSRNELLQFALGTVYENLGKSKEAEEAYKAAITINPNYFDALYNLGASYFNRGVAADKLCDEIPPSQKAKLTDCLAKADMEYEQAIMYLEKAFAQESNDKVLIRSLKDAYFRLEKMDKYNEMKALLDK